MVTAFTILLVIGLTVFAISMWLAAQEDRRQ
jgi:hypothetical protein